MKGDLLLAHSDAADAEVWLGTSACRRADQLEAPMLQLRGAVGARSTVGRQGRTKPTWTSLTAAYETAHRGLRDGRLIDARRLLDDLAATR